MMMIQYTNMFRQFYYRSFHLWCSVQKIFCSLFPNLEQISQYFSTPCLVMTPIWDLTRNTKSSLLVFIWLDCTVLASLLLLTDLVLISQLPSEASSSQQQVPPAFKNFSMSQKEKTLDELVKDKWLCRTREGNIGLGIRSLLDLRSWFRNNDVPSCEVCNEAGVKADLCPSEGCTVRIYKYCLKNLLSQKDDKVCSGCKNLWPLGTFTKREAVEETVNDDDDEENETQATAPRSKKRRQLRSHRDSNENHSSQASLASTSGATGRRVTRSVAHLK